jgi:LuxR family transcriptional regulator, maltose regulon positive regulatory protein
VETALLATKFYVPPARANLVNRPRLLNKLKTALNYNLVLVSAPAGFGKTTLVSEWVRQVQPEINIAWLSLDEGDNALVRFLEYFISAMQNFQPNIGMKALSFLNSNEKPPIESILIMLINDLTTIPQDFILILEDYHFVTSPDVHSALNFLLERMPPRMHLVIVTRLDPSLPLAHFRGKGMVLEIRADDLRFTIGETSSLLEVLDGPSLSSDDLKALNTRTEGWAVGLKMAFLSLREEKHILRFIADFTGSHRYIMDYLAEEVLLRQTESVQEFLLQTSILERLNASLCNAVTKRTDSREIMLELERANLFIIPLDMAQEWYRYEHLFTDFLQRLLREKHGQPLVSDLHSRASHWCEENNYPDDAINHALSAHDWERVIKLLYEHDWKRIKVGEGVKLINWFKVIPTELLMAHPLISLQYAFVLIQTNQVDLCELILNHLERINLEDAEFQGLVAMEQTHIGRLRGDAEKYIEKANKTLSLLPSIENETHKTISFFLGPILVDQRKYKESEPLLIETIDNAIKTKDYSVAVLPMSFWAYVNVCKGRLCQAEEVCRKALDYGEQSLPSMFALTVLSLVEYERNNLDVASNEISKALELNNIWQNNPISIMANSYSSMIHKAQGNSLEALKAGDRSDQACQSNCSPEEIARNVGCHLAVALEQDDKATINKWGKKVVEYAQILPPEVAHMPYRLLIAQGEKTLAAKQMQSAYDQMTTDGYYPMVKINLMRALAAPDTDAALPFLAEALKLGEPEGYVRTFVDEGKLIKPLLKKAILQGIKPNYASKLLSAIQAEEHQRHAKKCKIISSSSLVFGLLSKRELEVLHLIEKGFSDRQIADKLVISLSTAKTHVHHIFSKLNVKDRLQAVNRAKDLQLK